MAVDKLTVNDSRIKSSFAEVAGRRWHYLDAVPKGHQRGVVVLVHGFPDFSFAWRYQIPMLLDLGMRCIAIDCMGYGETGSSTKIEDFTFKNHADAIAGIAKSIGAPRIILGGHDWGGMVVYRATQWLPDLVSHVFSVATPYAGPLDQFIPTEVLVKGPLPNFGYQLQLSSEEQIVEKAVQGEPIVRKMLMGMYGGRTSSGRPFLTPEKGIDLDVLQNDDIAMTPLLNQEELDYYVSQFAKNGMNGPCNWYRTRRANFDDEEGMPAEQRKGIKQPTLFIQALNDSILKPEMSKGMEDKIPLLSRGEVKSGHWALWQTPQQTNEIIRNWFEGVVLGGKSKI